LAVKLIGEVVEGRLAKLQEEVDAESAKLEDADAAKAEFEKTMTDAETRLASTSEDVEKKKEELAAFTKVIMEKRSTLLSTQASHSQAQDPLQKAKVQKEQYEAISQDHLQPLLKEELAAEQATSHYQVVSPLIKDLDLEDSFKQALPGTFSKQTSDRTQFDNMVLQELEKRFNAHMENLGQFVAQQEPALEELSAAAAAAHEDH
jgi:chromosome segregation ATPase